MKRFFMFMVAILVVVFMQVPFSGTAEAARVAVVPIQIDEAHVERSADFNGYYWDIMIDKFKYPDYELMDDEKVAAVIPDEGLTSFDQATLMAVCDKVDAEIKKMYIKGEIEEVLTLRTDWQQQTFASELKRYINRTIEDKAKKKKSK